MKNIAGFFGVIALIGGVGCSGESGSAGGTGDEASTELGTADQSLLGNVTVTGCDATTTRMLNYSMEAARYVAVSIGMRECVAQTMGAANRLSDVGSIANFGPYLQRSDDPYRGSPLPTQIERAFFAATSSNDVGFTCNPDGYWGAVMGGVGSYRDDREAPEKMWVGTTLVNAGKSDNQLNATPSDWYQPVRTFAANTAWHEAMHAWGYTHPSAGDANYNMSIPQLVGACMETVMNRSAGCTMSCGANRRPVMRMTSNACDCIEDPAFDVGVILDSGATCPAMPGRGAPSELTLRMDDEDDSNSDQQSGWTGQITSKDTTFRFCATSGLRFSQAAAWETQTAVYAVARMGTTCPVGSWPFARYFDNEDDSNNNSSIGHVPPHVSGGDTRLELCVFSAGQAVTPRSTFPKLGVGYGVFAGTSMPGALQTGYIRSDDEDNNNGNYYVGNIAGTASFLEAGTNTKLKTARMKDGGSCDGSPGGWQGCRGSGCSVCTELTQQYPRYFLNHPSCSPNATCAGAHYTCNSDCPAPSQADR